ncbi:MAG TPA: hypothetical protein GX509_06090 [Firmicutes bacterium]|nr:hypothetical protein [Bacillota bacterium]HHY98291.1 hypothetical protein [Bacillota bacterium]
MEEVEVGNTGVFTEPLLRAIKELECIEAFGDPFDQCVAVEFECDDCCKKALNARILTIVDGLLILVGFNNGCILVKTISGGELVEKEVVRAIIIPLNRVCSVEFGAVQVDP